jgi:hypothetical protein
LSSVAPWALAYAAPAAYRDGSAHPASWILSHRQLNNAGRQNRAEPWLRARLADFQIRLFERRCPDDFVEIILEDILVAGQLPARLQSSN